MSDIAVEGDFRWVNSGQETNFTAWAGNEPTNVAAENCVAMTKDRAYFWSDEACDRNLSPICYA